MKKLLAGLLSFVMTATVVATPLGESLSSKIVNTSISASAYTSGDYEYEMLGDGTVEITKYNGSASNLTIPSTIKGKKVTSIGHSAFYCCDNIINLIMPNAITYIGPGAFWGCTNLNNITISKDLKIIDDDAFYSCYNLKTLVLPNGLTTIKTGAFYFCSDIKNIIIPNSVIDIESYAFCNCDSLKHVTISKNISNIGECAFGYDFMQKPYNEFYIDCYKGTVGEQYAKKNGFKYEIIEENSEDNYIQTHKNFLNSTAYKQLTDYNRNDTIRYASLLKNGYDKTAGPFCAAAWNFISMNFFNNPYDVLISDFILSENVYKINENSFSKYYSQETSDNVNKIYDLIESNWSAIKGVKFPGEEIKAYLEKGTSLSTKTKNNLKTILTNNKGTYNQALKKLTAIDDTFTFLDSTSNVIDALKNSVEYATTVNAYMQTDKEFKEYLEDISAEASIDSQNKDARQLSEAIDRYVNLQNTNQAAASMAINCAGNSFNVVIKMFKSDYINKIKNFFIGASGLSAAATATLNKWLSGFKIGYDLGMAINKLITSNDTVTANIDLIRCSSTFEKYSIASLKKYQLTFNDKPTYENAKMVHCGVHMLINCETYALDKYINNLDSTQKDFVHFVINFGKQYNSAEINEMKKLKSNVETFTCDISNPKLAAVSNFSIKLRRPNIATLSWKKVNGVDGYIIYRYDNKKKIWSRISKTLGTSYLVNRLNAGTQYKFAVKAYKIVNGKEFTSSTYPVVSLTTKLANVTGFKLSSTSTNSIKLKWNKVSGADGYIIYRYDNSNKFWIRTAKGKYNGACTVKKLKAGTSYKFAVKAYKTVSSKEITSSSYPQLTTSTLPATVSFKLTSGKKKATVKWSKVTGASGYKVYYKTSKNGSWKTLKTCNNKTTSYTKTKLASKKTYYFTVKAYRIVAGKTYNGAFTTKCVKIK